MTSLVKTSFIRGLQYCNASHIKKLLVPILMATFDAFLGGESNTYGIVCRRT